MPSILIDWLNENRGNARYKQLIGALAAIRKFMKLKTLRRKPSDPTFNPIWELWEALNKMLSSYKVFPHLMPPAADDSCSIFWMPVKAGTWSTWMNTERRAKATPWVGECNAVLTLLGLIRNGRIDRLRKCECKECAEWFYAKPSHKRFHSENCRQRHRRSSTKFKQKRKKYMQIYRLGQKELDRKAETAAKKLLNS